MTRTIAVVNQKGGVGKTTTSVNLAACLATMRKKVLLVDMDAQGNATMGSGVNKSELDITIYDMLTAPEEGDPRGALIHCEAAKYDLLPANGDLTAAEVELLDMMMKEHRLRHILRKIKDDYDYIIIDCPPSLSMLTVNALAAAESVLIPMQCEYYALEGLTALMDTITQIRDAINPQLQIEGILRTMYDPRNSLTNEVSQQLKDFFGDKLYRTVIPRNVRLAEAPSHGLSIVNYDKQSKGALAYLSLAGEMIRRHEKTVATSSI